MSLTVHLALVFYVFIAVAVTVMVCGLCGRHDCGRHGIRPKLIKIISLSLTQSEAVVCRVINVIIQRYLDVVRKVAELRRGFVL